MIWESIYLKNNGDISATYEEIKRIAIKQELTPVNHRLILLWNFFSYDPNAELLAWIANENYAIIQASYMFNYWDSMIS